MEPPRGVPVSNPLRLGDFLGFQRLTGRQRPAPRERGCAVPSRRRERPLGGAFRSVQEVLTERHAQACPDPYTRRCRSVVLVLVLVQP
jgi:hypothetical protein